jgi:F-type H+-transporting ATPase subunit epsilon
MKTFKAQILIPNKALFSGDILSVIVPTKEGQITILNNHTPIVSTLSIGEIVVEKENKEKETFNIQGGVVEVKQSGEVVILSDREIQIENIETEEIEKAKERAKKAMQDKDDVFVEIETENLERLMFAKKRGRNI